MTGAEQRGATTGRLSPRGGARPRNRRVAGFVLAASAVLVLAVPAGASAAGRGRPAGGQARVRVGPVLEVSHGCTGPSTEVEQAVDYPYVYEAWMGCGGIGFARSTDGGRTFGHPLAVPGSVVPGHLHVGPFVIPKKGWDPAVAVAPGGTVYLTWIYGHSLLKVFHGTGPAYVFLQKSSDAGKTWSRMTPVSPGHVQAAAAPLLVEPGGRIDVLMWVPHHDSFTSSADGGRTWSRLVAVRPGAGLITFGAVGIDAALGIDAAGTLYATWNTQRPGGDTGWLSYSTDHGRAWSPARRVTPGHNSTGHIMAVAGGRPGVAYLGWLSDDKGRGFADYLRPFSVRRGWLSAPVRVSRRFGAPGVHPGDTIGISVLPRGHGRPRVMLSWGSAVSRQISQIWAASATGS